MPKPHIIVIYMDDLGYGDVGAYGATRVATPRIDALAAEGVRFTDGYATSATCTPSRYALMTGRYPWRIDGAEILAGDAALIIDPAEVTLPRMLSEAGYRTGIVGKWHLGLGSGDAPIDWNAQISPGPGDVGFDESFIMAATQDRVPTVFIRDGFVVDADPNDPIDVDYETNFEGEPTALTHPEMVRMPWTHRHNDSIVNGIPRIGFMKGGTAARWVDEEIADRLMDEAVEFIQRDRPEPFFLYLPLHQPHVPRTPHPRFAGSTGMGPRGDAIAEADWCVGRIVDALEEAGLRDDTLIIFTSDNGPVLDDGYQDGAIELAGDHRPAGPLRGGKYSLFDGGTRVPFIVSWPGVVEPQTSSALVCQLDILASLAALVGSDAASVDGENLSDALLGRSPHGRRSLVLEAMTHTVFRAENWVLIPPSKGPEILAETGIESGHSDQYQLYDLGADIAETRNVAAEQPDRTADLIARYEEALR
ncbi:arylsulfatase [Microbacterium aquimaris]|uniref:sulfatase family protein n=1 Tax=Microbacterium aquimaris TaxID=459816 RepID=UPI002AD4F703|nr:arylsulfatase [Microbacterium aquimaris]MDZ8275265.1 arylsulfatase [Microbacterium aquimaris]